jgi:glycerophosphoryl diester phosphodiesterase
MQASSQRFRFSISSISPIFLIVFMLSSFLVSCDSGVIDLDVQGHRGCRGLMPENSLPAFHKACELGVTTLEMDVVITADSQVVVSHEAWFSHEFCNKPDGSPITEAEEKQYNIYKMDYTEVQRYECGQLAHPRFPDQVKMSVHKPLLATVLQEIEAAYPPDHTKDRKAIRYNIELKTEQGSSEFNPAPKEFVRLVLAQLAPYWDEQMPNSLLERLTLQSFDHEILREIRRQQTKVRIALLVEEEDLWEEQLKAFGDYPDILSPDFTQVNAEMLVFAANKNMKVIPWTVNEETDMRRLIKLGVHGIITDYPDRLIALLKDL